MLPLARTETNLTSKSSVDGLQCNYGLIKTAALMIMQKSKTIAKYQFFSYVITCCQK